jgi:hypothetical protein
MQGAFELETPRDLLEKLRYEFRNLEKDPNNSYIALNFFFTAEHMKDWVYPGRANEQKRIDLQDANPILQIVSHLANGAKHYKVEAKHHKSVADMIRFGSHFPEKNIPSGQPVPEHYPKGILKIQLRGDAEKQFGTRIGVVPFAKQVLDFWESRPEVQ